jgi:hypothetical protein
MQGARNHPRHLCIGNRAWTARTGVIHKALKTISLKPPPPLAHGMFMKPKLRTDLLAGQTVGAPKDDATTIRK